MLSVDECRRHLPKDSSLSESEILELRDQLYDAACLAVDLYKADQNRESRCGDRWSGPAPSLGSGTCEDQDWINERAALLEYEGGVERDAAEREALQMGREEALKCRQLPAPERTER